MSEATDSFHMNATIMNIKNDKKSVVSHNQTEMQIIARTGQLAAPTGNWGAGKTTVTIDLASSYQGEVWIAYNMELIENRQDGIIISGVRFIAAAAAKAEERDDEQPQDYEISPGRMAAIEGNAVYCSEDDMGFGGGYMAFVDPGMAWKIGTLDLSKYSSVEITYGSDGGALFAEGSNTFLALTQNGATQNSDYTAKEDTQILARTEQLAAPTGSWGAGKTTVTIDLSTDYSGEVWMAYNMEEINGQQKATSTLGTDYRGGIVGNLGSHGRCYRAVNGGYVRFGNAGVGYGNKNNLTHIYISPGTGKDFGATSIPLPIREDKNIYQGFDFTGDHDPNRQPVWVLGGTYSSENKMLPYLHSGKCYFQFAKYAP